MGMFSELSGRSVIYYKKQIKVAFFHQFSKEKSKHDLGSIALRTHNHAQLAFLMVATPTPTPTPNLFYTKRKAISIFIYFNISKNVQSCNCTCKLKNVPHAHTSKVFTKMDLHAHHILGLHIATCELRLHLYKSCSQRKKNRGTMKIYLHTAYHFGCSEARTHAFALTTF
jgi:hypothetical protein